MSSEKQHETSRDVSGRVLRAKELALAAARYGGVEDHRVGPWHALKECQSPGPAPRETFQKRKLINFSDFRTVNSEKVNNEKNEGLGLRSGMSNAARARTAGAGRDRGLKEIVATQFSLKARVRTL